MTTLAVDTSKITTAVRYASSPRLHPRCDGKSTLVISLTGEGATNGLKHRFKSVVPHHTFQPGIIKVTDILEACLHLPTGHDVSDDGLELTLVYPKGTLSDVLFAAGQRLCVRIEMICSTADSKYQISPTTLLIELRPVVS